MSLFRRHKKFEDQLKEQLGDSEYKPSESLWDRIDSGIAEDGFESGVQQSLENFEQVPYPETWEKIAAELPEERVGNRFLKYYGIGFMALLVFIGTYTGYRLSQQPLATESKPNTAITLNNAGESQNMTSEGVPQTSSDAGINNNGVAGGSDRVAGVGQIQVNEQKTTPEVVNNDAPGTGSEIGAVASTTNTQATPQRKTTLQRVINPASDKALSLQPKTTATNNKANGSIRPSTTPVQSSVTTRQVTAQTGNNTSAPRIIRNQSSSQAQADARVIRRRNAGPAVQPVVRRSTGKVSDKPEATARTSVAETPDQNNTNQGNQQASVIGGQTAQSTPLAQNNEGNGKVASQQTYEGNALATTAASSTASPEDKGAAGTGSSATFSNPSTVTGAPQVPAQMVAVENKPAAEEVKPQENVRVLTEAAPDSTIKNYQPPAEGEKLSPVSISIVTGVNMCYTTYAAPDNYASSFEKNIALRKKLERPDIDWSGAFLLDIRLTERWMLSSGVGMVNFSQKFDYNVVAAVNPPKQNEPGSAATNPGDSVVAGTGYTNRIKYSWTEIPLLINYTIVNKRWFNVDFQTGISYAFINTVDAGIIAYDNKGVLSVKNTEAFPQISSTIFVSAMPQISFKFNEQLSLGFIPSVKYSLPSIIGDERWVQQHPYFLGANICLRKRF
jgi:hypothetical protein